MLRRRYSKDRKTCTVTFIIEEEQSNGIKQANIAGDFNKWSKTDTPMEKNKDGCFQVSIKLNSGNEYQFRYFLDGNKWDNDWHADKYIKSPLYDLDNSVVVV